MEQAAWYFPASSLVSGSIQLNTSGSSATDQCRYAAAIGHRHSTHGQLNAVPVVTLPQKPPAGTRHMEWQEAARLVAEALGFRREIWCDIATRKEHVCGVRDRIRINRYQARFILLALAKGSRKAVILSCQWMPNTFAGWVDIDKAVIYRAHAEEIQTTTRKPPAALGDRILSYLRRWKRIDDAARRRAGDPSLYRTIINVRGRQIGDVKKGWIVPLDLAGLGRDIVRHTTRHTKATLAMQKGINIWEAAGALGMSAKTLEENYGHLHADFQKNVKQI